MHPVLGEDLVLLQQQVPGLGEAHPEVEVLPDPHLGMEPPTASTASAASSRSAG